MRVLHITSWYPDKINGKEALWVQRHIHALAPYIQEYLVLHIEVRPSTRIRFHRNNMSHGFQRRLEVPLNSWFAIEIMTALLLTYYLLKFRRRKFDIINFHVAYPLLAYWHLLKKWFKGPIAITEHWSAYHFNFGLHLSNDLPRIKRIFNQGIPLIAVSQALACDVKSFSKCNFSVSIVPNVVDDTVYYPNESTLREEFFFMVGQWKWPKKPLVVCEGFKEFIKLHPGFKLKIGGYGPDYSKIADWTDANDMNDSIILLGSMQPEEIACCLRSCKAFLHPTEYETFSVVCAEAVSCNTPVLASNVGGIPEVVREGEGLLIDSFDPIAWANSIEVVLKTKFTFVDRKQYSNNNVGKMYHHALSSIVAGSGGN